MDVKKLCRSNKNKIFCGVCGGIAEYLNIDPSVVRVLWVLFACLGGSGLLAYLIIAVIMPDSSRVI
ncbi:MAG: putative stress-responsive transcriptional regulator [Clostridia bacterium]|jgi:phage shock protein C|nr:putative stress-responsive transcriptional regulator [Clostridia bacterium]